MSALLDQHVPGWRALSPLGFRHAVNECDARVRAELRAAWEARVPEPAPAPVVAPPGPPPSGAPVAVPSSPRKRRTLAPE